MEVYPAGHERASYFAYWAKGKRAHVSKENVTAQTWSGSPVRLDPDHWPALGAGAGSRLRGAFTTLAHRPVGCIVLTGKVLLQMTNV